MADIDGSLWSYNLVKVTVIDVSDDYRLMQPPMPSECYPVLSERWLPTYKFLEHLTSDSLASGYLYDWHETTGNQFGPWFVGVVERSLAMPQTSAKEIAPSHRPQL